MDYAATKRMIAGLLLALAAPVAAQSGAPAALPAWLAGFWQSEDGIAWADETWNAPRGGIMQGMGRSGSGSRMQSWESMRIAARADGTLVFYAQPRGAAATEFPAVSIGPDAIEFANAAHDYPQRIRYWRQGQLLMAEISKIDGSDSQRWNFRPVQVGQ